MAIYVYICFPKKKAYLRDYKNIAYQGSIPDQSHKMLYFRILPT